MPIGVYHFISLKFCAKITNLPKEKGYFCAKSDRMLKIGFFGVQNPKAEQVDALREHGLFSLTGFYCADTLSPAAERGHFNLHLFGSFNEFCENVEAVFVTSPSLKQFDLYMQMLKKTKHLFFENPITFSREQSTKLIETASEAGVVIHFGHQNQVNPAYVAIKNSLHRPALIITQTTTSPTDKDNREVIDLLINDIIIAMLAADSEIKRVHASGVKVMGSTPDVIQTKIEFINGMVASLTGSRISTEKSHQTGFFGHNSHISVDFLNVQAKILITTSAKISGHFTDVIADPENMIVKELANFYNSIVHNIEPEVSVYASFKAIEVARQIMKKITASYQVK